MTLVADVPSPSGIVTDTLVDVGGWGFDKVSEGIADWVLGAVEFFVNGAIDFLRTSSTPDVGAAWFSGRDSPYAAVRNVAAFLLVGFAFLGIIQGLINGDTAGMIRRVAGNLPAAIAGMVATTAVVGHLLDLTDAMSDAVLVNTGGQALHFLSGFGATVTSATNGFAAVLLGIVAVVAGLLLWIELIVRASLVYILVAVSPLGFAATLWPSAKGILRKTVELLLAVIVSKLVISIALVIGVAALSGAGTAGAREPAGAGFESSAGGSLGALLVGAVLLGLAAFSPFIVLKLVPVAEAALVAQGVSRGPWRATQAGMSTAYSASTLSRIAGGGSGGRSPGATPGPGTGTPGGPGPGNAAGSAAGATGPAAVAVAGGSTVVSAAAQAASKVAGTASSTAGNAAGPRSGTAARRPAGGDQ